MKDFFSATFGFVGLGTAITLRSINEWLELLVLLLTLAPLLWKLFKHKKS